MRNLSLPSPHPCGVQQIRMLHANQRTVMFVYIPVPLELFLVYVAAARLLAWLAPRPRAWLFAACVAMHAAYAIASGARLAALAAMASFAYSFVVLQGARETWPEGHPGAPRG